MRRPKNLRRRLRQLEMENALLKKAAAIEPVQSSTSAGGRRAEGGCQKEREGSSVSAGAKKSDRQVHPCPEGGISDCVFLSSSRCCTERVLSLAQWRPLRTPILSRHFLLPVGRPFDAFD
jgi:hypothetical protein